MSVSEMGYVMSVLKRVLAALDGIASWRWATVTSVDPLRITPDGDTSPMAEAPDTLVGGLVVGDRVRLVIVARRALILGRAGGTRSIIIPAMNGWAWRNSGGRVTISGGQVTIYIEIRRTDATVTKGANGTVDIVNIPASIPVPNTSPLFCGYLATAGVICSLYLDGPNRKIYAYAEVSTTFTQNWDSRGVATWAA